MEWGLRTMVGLLGYNFCLDGNCLDPIPTSANEITSTQLQNGIFSHFNTSKDVTGNYSYVVPTEWDFDTIMDANFENNIGAGNLSEITKDITSIRIKRREKGTFDWVTIKEIPISGIEDFSFIFTDNLASNFTQYEYAYVPVIEQTEGNYTIEEVYSKFKGVFICDVNTIYKFYADIEYGSTDSVQKIGTYEPFGRKYPVMVSNGLLGYDTGTVSALIVPKNFSETHEFDRQAITKERNTLFKWLTNKKPKMLKDWNSSEWLCIITGNPQTDYESNYGMGIQRMTAEWTQTGDPKVKADLYANGLIPRED